jgi:lipoprotein-anchoring transpeptidase ErfK/SrfK
LNFIAASLLAIPIVKNSTTLIPILEGFRVPVDGRKKLQNVRQCKEPQSTANINLVDTKMLKVTNLSSAIRRSVLLSLMAILTASSALANTTEQLSAAEKAARIKEAESFLANLGYWITSVDGKSDDSTRQAIIAFQKVHRLKRTGVLDDKMLSAIRVATVPSPKYTGAAHVEIDISRQVIFLVNDAGQVTKVLSTSTGSGERYFSEGKWQTAYTPRGSFKIQRQIKGTRKAPLGELYNPSYFNGGIAIHGSNSIPVTAASHGCARIPRFADKQFVNMVSVGMPVYVYD